MKARWIAWILIGLAPVSVMGKDGDIVYSARYYKPGKQPSHYKIWRISSTGTKPVPLTSGASEDYSPIWMADGNTILFVRELENRQTLCTVGGQGGPVTELSGLRGRFDFAGNASPDRRFLVIRNLLSSTAELVLFDMTTRAKQRLGSGHNTAWSPDSRRLYISAWGLDKPPARIHDIESGTRVNLADDLTVATWVDTQTLVAEAFAPGAGPGRLVVLRADGVRVREVALPFSWDDDLSPFADGLFAVPGNPDVILYGRHAGGSTQGSAQKFYRVHLKTGKTFEVVTGQGLAWSPDAATFLTGAGRGLAPLDEKRHVWVSPLTLVSFPSGKARALVDGLVIVGGFDWKPAAPALREDQAPGGRGGRDSP